MALAWWTHSPFRLSASPVDVVRQPPFTQPGTPTSAVTRRPVPVAVSQRTEKRRLPSRFCRQTVTRSSVWLRSVV